MVSSLPANVSKYCAHLLYAHFPEDVLILGNVHIFEKCAYFGSAYFEKCAYLGYAYFEKCVFRMCLFREMIGSVSL